MTVVDLRVANLNGRVGIQIGSVQDVFDNDHTLPHRFFDKLC